MTIINREAFNFLDKLVIPFLCKIIFYFGVGSDVHRGHYSIAPETAWCVVVCLVEIDVEVVRGAEGICDTSCPHQIEIQTPAVDNAVLWGTI
jgi:hypothetical protein